jgi:ribosomal protein L29
MKYSDITQKNDKELATMLADQRKQLAQARSDMRTKQVSNVKQIAALKTTIAQLLTAVRQRELEAAQASLPQAAKVTNLKEEVNHG